MRNRRNQIIILNVISVLALLVVIFPLLLISQYNYPTADDWSFGRKGYELLQSGSGIWQVLRSTFATVRDNYMNWEGRFSAVLFASLQPGIFGEKCYVIVAYIMIGILVFSEITFCGYFVSIGVFRQNRRFILPITIPLLIMQILYSPSPEESFYWYTGSVNYTFVFGLSLLLIVLFFKLATQDYPRWKYVSMAVLAGLLAILVGGNNYATSLSCFLALCALSGFFLAVRRKAFYRTLFVTLLMGTSLMMCIFAPGNTNRLNTNFGGETGSALEAIGMSIVRSSVNIYSWTNIKVLLMLIFVIPFMWMAVKNMEFRFSVPPLFTVITFGLYSSQIVATMYVDGTTGGGRMAAILYYSYLLWIVGNVFYWLGWLRRRNFKRLQRLQEVGERFSSLLLPYCALIGFVLVILIYKTDLRNLTSYKAYRNWRQGFAQQYAAEWDARLEVLHDENVTQVEFAPLTVRPEMLLYTDLQEESGYYWVNRDCARYYGKEYVHIVLSDEE